MIVTLVHPQRLSTVSRYNYDMSHSYAIDFGTTNSLVARWNAGARETLPLPGISSKSGENHLVPSLLYVRDGRSADVAVGAEVQAGELDRRHDNRLFRNFKRSIGAANSPEARIIDGVPWSDADAAEHFLQHLLQALPCATDEIEQLTITVPVAAFEGYSAWLNRALTGFPSERLRIVDESTAAALGYAVTEPGANVLVIDFGGGTLDLSLVRLPESGSQAGSTLAALPDNGRAGAARVIAKAGVTLGGSDIDQWLLGEVLERAQLSASNLGLGYASLLSACEHAKITLSRDEAVEIGFQPEAGRTTLLSLTRNELEAVMEAHGFYAAMRQALDKVMGLAHQRGVFKEDIAHILLVGGTSLVPSVQRTLDSYFRSITHGRSKLSLPTWPALRWSVEDTSIRVDKPFTAVVEGALQVSAGLGLDDRLTYSYGLRVFDPNSGRMRYEEIIPAGSPCPSAAVTLKLAAAEPQQEAIEFVIGQIDTAGLQTVEVSYEAGQTVFVSKPDQEALKIVPINAAHPLRLRLDPPGAPGRERLRATFQVDQTRRLRLSVTDVKTHRQLVDEVITLGSPADEVAATGQPQSVPNCAPLLVVGKPVSGYRLSVHNLAGVLNRLAPGRVSDEALAAALRSKDSLVRFNTAELLCRRGDREARLIMDDVLTHGSAPQRASAAQHLYRFSWFAAEGLFRQALEDEDNRVRESAVFALCKMRAGEAYALALSALQHPEADDSLRMSAIWGAYSNPGAGAVPVLEQTLSAGDPKIREQALEVLGATGSEQAIPAVSAALDDPDLEVKYAATLSWVELAGEASLAELAELIETTRGEARQALLRGFFHASNYTALDVAGSPAGPAIIIALRTALADELPQTRLAAAAPLAWLRHPLAEQALQAGFAAERDVDAKAHMLALAVNFSSPVAGELLNAALQDDQLLVRQTAEYFQGINLKGAKP